LNRVVARTIKPTPRARAVKRKGPENIAGDDYCSSIVRHCCDRNRGRIGVLRLGQNRPVECIRFYIWSVFNGLIKADLVLVLQT
jgi:hypothetical protein